jgi:hypothetical protein
VSLRIADGPGVDPVEPEVDSEPVLTLDRFVDSGRLEERDALAMRSLSGEALTSEEQVRLASLDAMLAKVLPAPQRMPAHVIEAMNEARAMLAERDDKPVPGCSCYTCDGSPAIRSRMYLCAICGNKRCPHATDHRLDCSGSNAPGQEGLYYA